MSATNTVLCIHRDPGQLTILREKGYGLVTAQNGSEGLRLLMSSPVDAVVLEYYLGLMNGAVVADEIRRIKPQLPIVMVADPKELPHEALKSVDTLVDQSAGAHFLWAAVHFLLTTKSDHQSCPVPERTAKRGLGRKWTNARNRVRQTRVVAQSAGRQGEHPLSQDVGESIKGGNRAF